jgi:hypothetical protein
MKKAIEFHLDGMREDGDSIPRPTTVADYLEKFPFLRRPPEKVRQCAGNFQKQPGNE